MHWHPLLGLGTTMMCPRPWSRKFARQLSGTAFTIQSIHLYHQARTGKTIRHDSAEHKGNNLTPSAQHSHISMTGSPKISHTQIRLYLQNTCKQTWQCLLNIRKTVMQADLHDLRRTCCQSPVRRMWNMGGQNFPYFTFMPFLKKWWKFEPATYSIWLPTSLNIFL